MLLTAAVLKAYQFPTESSFHNLFNSKVISIAIVVIELLLGIWLATGAWQSLSWAAAVTCFACFAAVSFKMAMAGQASCGCFGQLSLNPWVTLLLDVTAVVALLCWPPFRIADHSPSYLAVFSTRAVETIWTWPAILIASAFAFPIFHPAFMTNAEFMLGTEETDLSTPANWLGKQWPLLPEVDIGERLSKGEWLVVLYRPDCPVCQESVRNYSRMTNGFAGLSVALVDILGAPSVDALDLEFEPSSHISYGKVNDRRTLFVTVPLVLILRDGVVISLLDKEKEPPTPFRDGITRFDSISLFHERPTQLCKRSSQISRAKERCTSPFVGSG